MFWWEPIRVLFSYICVCLPSHVYFCLKYWPFNPHEQWQTSCGTWCPQRHVSAYQQNKPLPPFLDTLPLWLSVLQIWMFMHFSTERERERQHMLNMCLYVCVFVPCWQQDYSESQIKSQWSKMWHQPLRCPCNDWVWKGLNAVGLSPITSASLAYSQSNWTAGRHV